MKNKGKLLIVTIFGLTLSSCSFNDFFSNIVALEIKDFHTSYYQGASFYDDNELQILATYSNGKQGYLKYTDVSISLRQGENTQSARETFNNDGEYEVTVQKLNVVSNTITIDVYNSLNYATSVSLSSSSGLNVDTLTDVEVDLSVDPYNYNLDYEFVLSSETATFTKVDKDKFIFNDYRPGESTVTVKAKSSSNDVITNSISFIVTTNYVEKQIQQTYKTLSLKNCPTVGDVNILVIPLWFKDSGTYITKNAETVRKDIELAYFGTSAQIGWHSVASYYKEESGGLFNLSGTVSEWYRPDKYVKDYATDDESGSNTFDLIKDATNWYFTNYEDERTNYDSDHDGYIDGVMMIYAAPDCYSYGVSDEYRNNTNLWAYYTYSDSVTANVSSPNVKSVFWASYDFMYGHVDALQKTGNPYYKGTTAYCSIDTHTYIHEMGHVFGLEDYYDYSQQYRPAGGFSMQDYNVGAHDPFSVMSFGWAKPFIPTSSGRIQIGLFQKTKELILLTPSWNSHDSVFDEYLLLELYSPNGLNSFDSNHVYAPFGATYPQGPSTIGIRLWHVDARLTYRNFTTYTTDLFTDATSHFNSMTAFSNTFIKKSYNEVHVTPLARTDTSYALYNLLTLVRNNKNASFKNKTLFTSNDLFYAGDSFSMDEFGGQFAYKAIHSSSINVLDSGIELGWTFTVESIKNGQAIINVTKL